MENSKNEKFISLLLPHYRKIYGFILTLMPHKPDADDIMQETALVMCRKFDNFTPGTNFIGWALTIARNQVIMFRRKNKSLKYCFKHITLKTFIEYAAKEVKDMDYRIAALEECVKKLKDRDRELIKLRYKKDIKIKEIAKKIGRSENGIYKSFARIHNYLRLCVRHTMAAWGF